MQDASTSYIVLVVDPDARQRALLADQLAPLACTVLQADEGDKALHMVRDIDVRLVITELYLHAGEDDDLIHAIRRNRALRKTRTLVHTAHATAADRDWALRAGADAYLIKPTRAERVRYVVGRLATTRAPHPTVTQTSTSAIQRRDSLDDALKELERGVLRGTSAIVFGRQWWETLPRAEQTEYRRRARKAKVSLRSDTMIGQHFVEVRGPSRPEQALSTERPESPYRR
jgi:CheY-like chemotaxis protein